MEFIRSKKQKKGRGPGSPGGNGGQGVKLEIKSETDILDTVITQANEIYSHLGSGHTESVYHRAMESELRSSSIKYESEVITPIMYKSYYVGYGRADIVVNRLDTNPDKTIILELKALSTNAFKQNEIARLRTYMKSLGIKRGLMVNFPQAPSSTKCIFHYITE